MPEHESGKNRHAALRRIKNSQLAATGRHWAFADLTAAPGAHAHYNRRWATGDRYREQAHAVVEGAVDLVPALQGGPGAGPVVEGRVQYGGPAGAVCLHLAQGGFAQVVPHMPAVRDLDRVGQGAADGLGVGGRAVRAHDLDARMPAQPRLKRVGRAVGQHVDPLMALGVDDHGGIAVPAAQSEVIDADHAGRPPDGQRGAQRRAQGRCGGTGPPPVPPTHVIPPGLLTP